MSANDPEMSRKPGISRDPAEVKRKVHWAIKHLCDEWDLQLKPFPEGESPQKRPQTLQRKAVDQISLICWKGKIEDLIESFDKQAHELYIGWVPKPKADHGIIPPRTHHKRKDVTDQQRNLLLQCLLEVLREVSAKTPRSSRHSQIIDDSPVSKFKLQVIAKDAKRRGEPFESLNSQFKKPRVPERFEIQPVSSPTITENIIVNRNNTDLLSNGKMMNTASSVNDKGSSLWASTSTVNSNSFASYNATRSAQTSFSDTSFTKSIFSLGDLNESRESLAINLTQDTSYSQDTVANDDEESGIQSKEPVTERQREQQKGSDFGSSFDPDALDIQIDGNGPSKNDISVEKMSQELQECGLDMEKDPIKETTTDNLDTSKVHDRRLRGIFRELIF
jgi:hypothetical protein